VLTNPALRCCCPRNLLAAGFLASTVLLAGCGSGANDGKRGRLVVENRPAPPVQQVLRKANFSEPDTLDPARSGISFSAFILLDLYEGLTNLDSHGRPVPGVASSWEKSADGRTYTFHLRPDARWSNGAPITADDFVFSLRRAVTPATAASLADLLAPITNARDILAGRISPEALGVRAPDAHTLVIEMSVPAPYLPALMANPVSFPVYPPAVKKWGRRFTEPAHSVTNGAYRLADWIVNGHLTLVRNRHYWNDAATRINKVIYYPITGDAAFQRYRADDLDFTFEAPTEKIHWIKQHMPRDLVQQPYAGIYKFDFNVTRPPFHDARDLRRALSMVIDRRIIVERVTRGGEQPAFTVVPPLPGYRRAMPEWARWSMQRRIEAARRLYRKAGYSREHPLHTRILFSNAGNRKRLSEALAAMWKQTLGVRTELVNEESRIYIEDSRLRRSTEVTAASWVADYLDAYDFLHTYEASAPDNFAGYANPRYDALLEAAQQQADPEKRSAMMTQAEKMLLEDQPTMPVYYYAESRLLKPWVKGYKPNPLDYHYTREMVILAHHRER
jgi:ABC-type oligopeptide transport system substrate-binding subunit